MSRYYFVYMLTNQRHSVIYTGVTGQLQARVYQHKNKIYQGFTSRYNADILVYYETFEDIYAAIHREKQIKAGSRQKKIDLINSANPEWRDLYYEL